MQRLFLQLTVANLALLTIVVGWGHVPGAAQDTRFDVLAGIAAIFTLFVHSFVYTYFIAAGKFVETAIEEHGYSDRSAAARARRNKLQAFRWGFLAICAVFAALVLHLRSGPLGGDEAMWRGWAAAGAYVGLLLNLYAARKEWNYLVDNGVITDGILVALGDRGEGEGARPPSPL